MKQFSFLIFNKAHKSHHSAYYNGTHYECNVLQCGSVARALTVPTHLGGKWMTPKLNTHIDVNTDINKSARTQARRQTDTQTHTNTNTPLGKTNICEITRYCEGKLLKQFSLEYISKIV